MGKKAEFGTPKYVANKMKAKGLQKLRWYCQMCQKQCRDENGFKCHVSSESHQRQMLLFGDNAGRYLDEFSGEFCKGFLETLKRTCGTKRVQANKVYQSYISYKDHCHMNATRWHSLTGFCKYLGREGKCIVDETEKGWFISYIDRDPETIAQQEALAKKKRMDKDDEERLQEFINKQVEMGTKEEPEPEFTELVRESEEEKIKVDIALAEKKLRMSDKFIMPYNVLSVKKETKKIKLEKDANPGSSRKCALDDILIEEETKKERKNRKDYWLCEEIVVKVTASSLGEKYYKKKGLVEEVLDKYTATVRMLDSGDLIKVDQAHLETVIPAEGRKVRVVNGAYRGETAIMCGLRQDEFCATLEICKGPLKGRVLNNVRYEDFSKLHIS